MALAATVITLSACSGSDDSATNRTDSTQNPPSGSVGAAAIRDVSQPAMGPVSDTYLSALCAIDPFETASVDDPIAALIDQFEAVPATNDDERAELDQLTSGLAAANDSDDPEPLIEVGGILRARCSALVMAP
jgi:hypothetical protein